MRKKYNLMVDLTKFTSNKKILGGVAAISYNIVCSQTLSIFIWVIINL